MKTITLRIDDRLYEELLKKAKEEGFLTIAEYLNSLLLRVVEGIEKPETKEVAEDESKRSPALDRLLALIERKIQDGINPFTQKIDDISRRIATTIERIDYLEDRIKSLEDKVKGLEAQREEIKEKKAKKSAIDILREQKIIFERDVASKIKDRDSFFARLEREGATVIEAKGERIAVDPQFWQTFLQKLKGIKTNNDEELKRILDSKEFKLLQKLRESALLIFDGVSKSWSLLL